MYSKKSVSFKAFEIQRKRWKTLLINIGNRNRDGEVLFYLRDPDNIVQLSYLLRESFYALMSLSGRFGILILYTILPQLCVPFFIGLFTWLGGSLTWIMSQLCCTQRNYSEEVVFRHIWLILAHGGKNSLIRLFPYTKLRPSRSIDSRQLINFSGSDNCHSKGIYQIKRKQNDAVGTQYFRHPSSRNPIWNSHLRTLVQRFVGLQILESKQKWRLERGAFRVKYTAKI